MVKRFRKSFVFVKYQISLQTKQTKDKPSGVDFSDAKQNLKKEVVRII